VIRTGNARTALAAWRNDFGLPVCFTSQAQKIKWETQQKAASAAEAATTTVRLVTIWTALRSDLADVVEASTLIRWNQAVIVDVTCENTSL
jgi:hypothetical protein